MQGKTLLIIGRNAVKRKETIDKIFQEYAIDKIDIVLLEKEGSIGIMDIRLLQKQSIVKPLRSLTKACVIHHAHTLTFEAQNAFLKMLEEPPDNTLIILSAENTNTFLPTVLSRCTIIYTKEIEPSLSHIENDTILDVLQTKTLGQKLQLAQNLAKNKDEAIAWLEKMILTLRLKFIKNPSNPSLFIIHYSLFQKTYVTLKTTNTNLRLTLENLFLTV